MKKTLLHAALGVGVLIALATGEEEKANVAEEAVAAEAAKEKSSVEITSTEYEEMQVKAAGYLNSLPQENKAIKYDWEDGSTSYILDPERDLYSSLYRSVDEYATNNDQLRHRGMVMPSYHSYDMFHKPRSYPPGKKPLLKHFPCCHYADPQRYLGLVIDPSSHSPEYNCKTLQSAFLPAHTDEQHFHKCAYGTAHGGSANYKETSDNVVLKRDKNLSVIMMGKGSCANVYFSPHSGFSLKAPAVDAHGNCLRPHPNQPKLKDDYTYVSNPGDYHNAHARRLSGYEYVYKKPRPSPYTYQQQRVKQSNDGGYDYILECQCLCEQFNHLQDHTYERQHYGYN